MKKDKLYTVKELSNADWFPHRERTIWKQIKDKKLSVINANITGRSAVFLIKESEVERYLKTLEVK